MPSEVQAALDRVRKTIGEPSENPTSEHAGLRAQLAAMIPDGARTLGAEFFVEFRGRTWPAYWDATTGTVAIRKEHHP